MSGRSTAATASSPRPTSTSSAGTRSAFDSDVEIPLVIGDALRSLPIPPVTIQINNRKLMEGFFRGVGIADTGSRDARRGQARQDRSGRPSRNSWSAAGRDRRTGEVVPALVEISSPDASFADAVRALGVTDPLLDEGLDELVRVIETAAEHAPGLAVAQLKIARGLDYYTGTVYETTMHGYESAGSICSGGRYDNLASSGSSVFPGVGISIGVSRILGLLFGAEALTVSRSVPTCVLVALPDDESRPACMRIASALRSRGIADRGGPGAGEVRQADPVRRPPRYPVRLVPRCRRRFRQGHPQRRPGAR